MTQENTQRQSKTIFLFGAGASYPAGIPLIDEMTSEFLKDPLQVKVDVGFFEALGSNETNESLRTSLELLSKITLDSFGKMDLELMMSLLLQLEDTRYRELLENKYPTLKKIFQEKANFSTTFPLWFYKQAIQNYIRNKCEQIKTIDHLWPLDGMSKNQQLKIFTLNYDATIEIFCEKNGIKYTDGFDPDWNIKRFDDNYQIHLYKLHGSLYWFRTESNKTIKVPMKGLKISEVTYLTDETVSEMMIYPTLEKNKQLGVYSWLSQKFKDELNSSEICVIVGYSFRDGDIRDSIVEALSTNPNLWLVLVSPHASSHKEVIFSNDEEISSRILTMDMGFIQAITDRNLNSYLDILNPVREMEFGLWASQSTSQVRLDTEWGHILKNYLRVGHHDRIKWIVGELSKRYFSHFNNNFPDSIEGAVCSKSLTYALEYQKNGNKEKMNLWTKIFVESCIVIEYRFFGIVMPSISNPVKRSDLPDWYADGGNNSKDQIMGLRDGVKKIESSTSDSTLKEKLSKFSETLDQLYRLWQNDDTKTYFSTFADVYKNRDMGLKKWATEIANLLK